MVKKRCVLYFCGFDPSGPAHYHRLYREQAALQSKVSGATINVGARQNLAKEISKWDIQYASGNESVHTDYHFMRWDDVVRQHWKPSGVQVAWQTLSANAEYMSNGALRAMFRLAWPPSIAIFSPAVLLVFLLLFVPVVSLKISHASHWIAGLGFLGTMLVLAWLAEKKFNMQWLIRSFAFTAAQARGKIPAYDQRVRQFAAHTQQLLLAGYDEVLLVGHSSGTFLAISSLAQALRAMPMKAHAAPSISLLTLGHWTPMLSSLPAAQSFRDDLQTLAHAERVQWIDFGAPADGCCFALVDPLSAVDLAPPIKHPKLLSPRFAQLFSPQRYKLLKKDRFDLHFQYIKASELFGEYDYFAITAGAQDLAQRFSHLPSVTDFRQFRLFG